MQLTYERRSEGFSAEWKTSVHVPPHLHDDVEIVYVTDGTVEIGVGEELFHMEKGDFAIVFPNLVHHYQVFSEGSNSAIYVYPVVSATGNFHEELYKYQPENPIISEKDIHRDVLNAILALNKEENMDPVIAQSYVQIILARCMPLYELKEKQANQGDTIYRTVSYIAAHFKEDITLNTMSKALAINKYALSRIFSGVFHTNFNQYLNVFGKFYQKCRSRNAWECAASPAAFPGKKNIHRAPVKIKGVTFYYLQCFLYIFHAFVP